MISEKNIIVYNLIKFNTINYHDIDNIVSYLTIKIILKPIITFKFGFGYLINSYNLRKGYTAEVNW